MQKRKIMRWMNNIKNDKFSLFFFKFNKILMLKLSDVWRPQLIFIHFTKISHKIQKILLVLRNFVKIKLEN